MKDLENQKVPISRFRNKIYSKYENALIYKFNDNDLSEIMRGERNFKTIDWYPEYSGNRKYKSKQIFYKNVYNKESHDYGTENILFENGHSRKTKRSCR